MKIVLMGSLFFASAALAQTSSRQVSVDIGRIDEDSSYTVSAGEGVERQTCKVPCTMRLSPGQTTLSVTGDHEFERRVKIDDEAMRLNIGYRSPLPVLLISLGLIAASSLLGVLSCGAVARGMPDAQDPGFCGLAAGGGLGGIIGLITGIVMATKANRVDGAD
jgi:hypothetical protein